MHRIEFSIFSFSGSRIVSPSRCLSRSRRREIKCPRSYSSTTSRRLGYSDTIHNLKIGSHTKVIYQGFTGRQATVDAKASLEWGTKVVGGVKPGFEGEHLGLPVLPSVKAAQQALKPDATAIYVPGNGTAQAIEEAIEAEIPLVVAVAEFMPIHDLLRIHSMLKTQSKTRLVGANCPGIINVQGRCRIGFQPLPFFTEGKVGIIAKSGTLSYETVASTTRAGIGQTYCISMGGDVLAGTNFVDALKIFEDDAATEGIIMIGEVGGKAEVDAAEWIRDYKRRVSNPKPIMALIGGIHAPPGRVMGHAGAWAAPGEPDAAAKIKALEEVGVVLVNHPEKFGEGMKQLLSKRSNKPSSSTFSGYQRRSIHTRRHRPLPWKNAHKSLQQHRSLYLKQHQAFDMLKQHNIACSETSSGSFSIGVSIDRSSLSACIVAAQVANGEDIPINSKLWPFDVRSVSADSLDIAEITSYLGLNENAQESIKKLLQQLLDIYIGKEAFVLETRVSINASGDLTVTRARFGFDDSAFRSAGRQKEVHSLRNKAEEVPEEIEAEKYGIVYVKLPGAGHIGTLVNGAGLAMNTVDAIIDHGGHPANFLDTGGKATSETVKASFKVITTDPRVKVIFVNIFGGLTRSDMIAEGIILAFRDLQLKVPVVVRLRGTNEAIGQKMIAESGLPLQAFDSFDDAAEKVIALANGTETA